MRLVYENHVGILGSLKTDSSEEGRAFLASRAEADDVK